MLNLFRMALLLGGVATRLLALCVCALASKELEIVNAGKVFSSAAKSITFPKVLEQHRAAAIGDSWGA